MRAPRAKRPSLAAVCLRFKVRAPILGFTDFSLVWVRFEVRALGWYTMGSYGFQIRGRN